MCKYCKHFNCSYIKNGYMNIECDKRYFEITFELGTPFVCGRFKPNKKGKLFLKKQAHQHENKGE